MVEISSNPKMPILEKMGTKVVPMSKPTIIKKGANTKNSNKAKADITETAVTEVPRLEKGHREG